MLIKDKLFNLIDDFLTVRSVVTLGAFITLYVMVWQGKEVPPIIAHLVDILLGFWFGQKTAQVIKQLKE